MFGCFSHRGSLSVSYWADRVTMSKNWLMQTVSASQGGVRR